MIITIEASPMPNLKDMSYRQVLTGTLLALTRLFGLDVDIFPVPDPDQAADLSMVLWSDVAGDRLQFGNMHRSANVAGYAFSVYGVETEKYGEMDVATRLMTVKVRGSRATAYRVLEFVQFYLSGSQFEADPSWHLDGCPIG
jgi:hypothetical protein